jgi:hypothetical protein
VQHVARSKVVQGWTSLGPTINVVDHRSPKTTRPPAA